MRQWGHMTEVEVLTVFLKARCPHRCIRNVWSCASARYLCVRDWHCGLLV